MSNEISEKQLVVGASYRLPRERIGEFVGIIDASCEVETGIGMMPDWQEEAVFRVAGERKLLSIPMSTALSCKRLSDHA